MYTYKVTVRIIDSDEYTRTTNKGEECDEEDFEEEDAEDEGKHKIWITPDRRSVFSLWIRDSTLKLHLVN